MKILAIRNGEKSIILNGEITATIPRTSVAQTITEAIMSPNTIQFSSFLAEITPKYISGKQFPNATIKTPTKAKETFSVAAKY